MNLNVKICFQVDIKFKIMSKTTEKNHFVNKLLQLQNLIKRDPTSYKDEVYIIFQKNK